MYNQRGGKCDHYSTIGNENETYNLRGVYTQRAETKEEEEKTKKKRRTQTDIIASNECLVTYLLEVYLSRSIVARMAVWDTYW